MRRDVLGGIVIDGLGGRPARAHRHPHDDLGRVGAYGLGDDGARKAVTVVGRRIGDDPGGLDESPGAARYEFGVARPGADAVEGAGGCRCISSDVTGAGGCGCCR